MTDADRYGGFTPMRATRFYIPLFLQAFSQSLTYPLVASIVSHGAFGVTTLTAFAQGQTVMFMIGAVGGGLVMTGMVFARTLSGYRSYIRLNTWMMCSLLAIQTICAFPPFDGLIFRDLLNLPPALAETARQTLLWGFVMQASFFLRNVPLVVLFNNRASFEANIATTVRILLTLAAPYLFIRLGWTGALWGLTATTIPCVIEYLITHLYARRFVKTLHDDAADTDPSDAWCQFRFTLPLAFGNLLLAAAPFMIAYFVGRTQDALAMLAIHYVTIGLANPVGYGALRMQAVAIQFPPEHPRDRRVLRYAAGVGLILGVIPLLLTNPTLGNWYFCTVQNLPAEHVPLARIVICCYASWPILQCLRGYAEGHAARLKLPSALLWGQIAHLTLLVAALALSLHFGLPGWLMGFSAILTATLATICVLALALHRGRP